MQGQDANINDFIGKKFGKLTIIKETDRVGNSRCVLTKCDCGNEQTNSLSSISSGNTKSCGCLRKNVMRKRSTTHGLSDHPLYSVYHNMIQRCYYTKAEHYYRYGGRGVSVCEEWKNSFKAFYDWAVSKGWHEGLEVDKDKIGTGLLYSPEMCCLLTPKENGNCSRRNKLLEYNGKIQSVSMWAEEISINPFTLYRRLGLGWTAKKTIETPLITTFKKKSNVCL